MAESPKNTIPCTCCPTCASQHKAALVLLQGIKEYFMMEDLLGRQFHLREAVKEEIRVFLKPTVERWEMSNTTSESDYVKYIDECLRKTVAMPPAQKALLIGLLLGEGFDAHHGFPAMCIEIWKEEKYHKMLQNRVREEVRAHNGPADTFFVVINQNDADRLRGVLPVDSLSGEVRPGVTGFIRVVLKNDPMFQMRAVEHFMGKFVPMPMEEGPTDEEEALYRES